MSDRDLNHLYEPFRIKVRAVLFELDRWSQAHNPGYEWIVVEGLRSAAYQNELYQQGRTKPGRIVTYKDGYNNPSNHQSGLAVDIVPRKIATHEIDWEPSEDALDYQAHCARAEGLVSGHDWKKFKDSAHIEWPTSDRETYAAAKKWLKDSGLS